MERTSDKADGFSAGDIRAEELIAANKARLTPALRTAQKLERDDRASEELDWDAAAKACGVDPKEVIAASVRGDYVVVAVRDPEDGRTHKAAELLSEVGKPRRPKKDSDESEGKAKAKPKTSKK